MQTRTRTAVLRAATILLALCSAQTVYADKLQIYTVNYPLAYFAERIAGGLAEVSFPAPHGVDPAFWVPDADTIAAYQTADLTLLNGAGYAKWTEKVSLPRSRLLDTSRGFKEALIREENGVSHSHGPGGDHAHGGLAFTTWLDLSQATQQAEAVARALTRKRPDAKDEIDKNLQVLHSELLALDEQIGEVTRRDPTRPLLASHPVYQYLARRYDLYLNSLTWEPDEMPSDAQWAHLGGILSKHPARWMLWEAKPAAEIVERLRALDVESLVLNPCANLPSTGDFLTVMSKNAKALERIFGQDSGEQ